METIERMVSRVSTSTASYRARVASAAASTRLELDMSTLFGAHPAAIPGTISCRARLR